MSSKKKSVLSKGKQPAPAPKKATVAKAGAKKSAGFVATHEHLFEKRTRTFRIGGDTPLKGQRDLTRYTKWPKYVRLQRQRAILKKRLKVPPTIHQFTRTLDKNGAANLFRLLSHYRPESPAEKKARQQAKAAEEAKGDASHAKTPKPIAIKFGLNHVTTLVESKKAKLVIIAHDVDPIELVLWLPALCRKLNVPYVIVKGKSRLGHLVHHKTASALAITEVRKEDAPKLEQLVQNARLLFNDNLTDRKKWGGGVVGIKAQHVIRHRERTLAKELASKSA